MNLFKMLGLMPKMFMFAEGDAGAGGGTSAGAQGGEGGAGSQDQNKPGEGGQEDNKSVPLSALIEERKARQELRNELDALKATVGQQQPQFDMYGNPVHQQPQQMQQQQYQQVQQPDVQQWQNMFEENPAQAVAAMVQQAVGNAISGYDRVNSTVEVGVRDAVQRFQDFGQYEQQVRQELMKVQPAQRGNPQVIDAAYYMVKGRNVDAIIKQQQEQFQQNVQSGQNVGGFGGGGAGAGQNQGGTKLTQEQINVCSAMGISPEDYLKSVR